MNSEALGSEADRSALSFGLTQVPMMGLSQSRILPDETSVEHTAVDAANY